MKIEIKDGLKEWLYSIEDDENRRQHLRAFGDFCLDLLEEEYGRIPAGEEIDPRFIKGSSSERKALRNFGLDKFAIEWLKIRCPVANFTNTTYI